MAVLLTKKSLARRVYATILNAGTNTDGSKEQGAGGPRGGGGGRGGVHPVAGVLRPGPAPTAGVTFPSGDVQEQLIRSLYAPAGPDPESLEYIEAHGTGTKVRPRLAASTPYPPTPRDAPVSLHLPESPQVGDPQELNGIVNALCATRREPLLIGSTKSNMGHPEPASGVAALIKVGVWA